jgi:predicted transcriptional regulator
MNSELNKEEIKRLKSLATQSRASKALLKSLEKLEKLGLVKEECGKWTLTEKGELYV